jgi:REP element-mobilizing transposase RayT
MPDHAHLLLLGERLTSDLLRFVHRWKQKVGFLVRRACGRALWQDGFYDHVLRDEEDSFRIAAYIVANPVRAGLANSITEYPYSGSCVYSLQALASVWERRD